LKKENPVINKTKHTGKVRILIIFAALFLAVFPFIVLAQDTRGKELYDGFCARCHGFDGDGKGEASNFTFPKPRDFTSGIYKFRTTPSGDPPIDEDIKRIILRGIPGTSMTGWAGKFGNDELDAMVQYLKSFAEETFEFPGEPFEIGEVPPVTEERLKEGEEIFVKAKCWECHGKFGRGDGEKGWQDGFKDDWGDRIYPTNLTHSWELRHGASVRDLFRTLTSGFDGTPMASFQDAYSDDQRWNLAHYLKSLQIERKFDAILQGKKVENIPSSTDDDQWNKADYIDIKMEGKKLFGFPFIPMITNMRLRTLYTESEIAMMLEWMDKKPNKGDDDFPPDAARLQFPLRLSSNARQPNMTQKDRKNLLYFWYWKTSDNLTIEMNAKGPREQDITIQEKSELSAISNYSNGLYRVILKRRLKTDDENDIPITFDKHIPFTIIAYDGQHNEEGNRGAISTVHYFLLKASSS
jgi:DMSO reductase family type II enzyme heme b subunit